MTARFSSGTGLGNNTIYKCAVVIVIRPTPPVFLGSFSLSLSMSLCFYRRFSRTLPPFCSLSFLFFFFNAVHPYLIIPTTSVSVRRVCVYRVRTVKRAAERKIRASAKYRISGLFSAPTIKTLTDRQRHI